MVVGREKLAADLGFHLKISIAPVHISRQTAGHSVVLPPVVALSYETLVAGKDWEKFGPTPEDLKKLKPMFTALWVLHGWIAERDHRGAGWNLKGERVAKGSVHVSSFDYVQSLNDQWRPPDPPAPHPDWNNPTGVYADPDLTVAAKVIGQIRGFTAERLKAIVGALPPDCMPPKEGNALACGLYERGKQLESLLGLRSPHAKKSP